jgi:DNA-directed RNA polymerase specialized sigma24 family protein
VRCEGTSRSRFAVIDALNAEWEELQRCRPLNDHGPSEIVRWASKRPPLRGCRSAADVLVAIRTDPDPVLAALIEIHQTCRRSQPRAPATVHLAGRIVLQTMLGKIVAMARRDAAHSVEDYVGQLWARIDGYPLAHRPRRIAANLALDTLKSVTRDSRAPTVPRFVPVAAADLELVGLRYTTLAQPAALGLSGFFSDRDVSDLTAHRVLRVAQDLGFIDEPTRRLLHSVYVDGLCSADAASRHGLTSTAVRFRCSKAIRRMAQHAKSIADAV